MDAEAQLRGALYFGLKYPGIGFRYRTSYLIIKEAVGGFCLTCIKPSCTAFQDEKLRKFFSTKCLSRSLHCSGGPRAPLSYGECFLPGTSDEELILISTIACHPSVCHDKSFRN